MCSPRAVMANVFTEGRDGQCVRQATTCTHAAVRGFQMPAPHSAARYRTMSSWPRHEFKLYAVYHLRCLRCVLNWRPQPTGKLYSWSTIFQRQGCMPALLGVLALSQQLRRLLLASKPACLPARWRQFHRIVAPTETVVRHNIYMKSST